ncbi:MAG: DNA methyltransferase [Gemmatales bacterium]|nr:DNA methyltransferase [Gemmatales bacterium]
MTSRPARSLFGENDSLRKTKTFQAEQQRCNLLDGATWLQYSISVWDDVRKTVEEQRLGHPAMFPMALADRLIQIFLPPEGRRILDPFVGSGSTVLAAVQRGKEGVGIDISAEYIRLAKKRLQQGQLLAQAESLWTLSVGDCREVLPKFAECSFDLCITSPPYWNILNQRRTADGRAIRHYGNRPGDLATIADYGEFLKALGGVFAEVLRVLKPGCYCCVVVMDLRKQNRFYPFHSDLASELVCRGFEWDDLIIWNRASEYNNLRPLGYPYRFRVNKIHEYILIMRKPKSPR